MNKTMDNTSSGGIGFFGLLQLVFITLKLTHVIEWSWWLVLSPILIAAGFVLVLVLLLLLIDR